LKEGVFLYSTKLITGNAEIISNGTIISFFPDITDPIYHGKNVYSISPPSSAIEMYWDQAFLFSITFDIILKDQDSEEISWRSEVVDPSTYKITLKNIALSKTPMESSFSLEIATSTNGDKFYLAFSATATGLSTLIHYNIYLIRREEP